MKITIELNACNEYQEVKLRGLVEMIKFICHHFIMGHQKNSGKCVVENI